MGLGEKAAKFFRTGIDLSQVKEELQECGEDMREFNFRGAAWNALQAGGVALNTLGVKNVVVDALQASVAAEQAAELMEVMKEGTRKEIILEVLQTGEMSADVAETLIRRGVVPEDLVERVREIARK